MAGKHLKEFTGGNFVAEVINSSLPVLVDFWAEWCPPCKMLTPTIEKLANDYAGKAVIGKLDIDANQSVAVRYKVSSIPTVILFKDGEVVQQFVGLRHERDYKTALDAICD